MVNIKELEPTKLADIEKELAANSLQDQKKEYGYYDLRNHASSNKISYKPTDVFYYVSGNCLYDQVSLFYCVNNGHIEFENMSNKEQFKTLTMTLEFPDGKIEKINGKIPIPVGKSHYLLSKNTNKNVFPVPKNVPIWPVNMGYPNFIIQEIGLQ